MLSSLEYPTLLPGGYYLQLRLSLSLRFLAAYATSIKSTKWNFGQLFRPAPLAAFGSIYVDAC